MYISDDDDEEQEQEQNGEMKRSLCLSKLRRDFRHYIFTDEEDGDGRLCFSSDAMVLLSKREPEREFY